MCSLQNWHFPLKKQYEIIGIFVYQFSLLLHLGHLDGGKTMLSPDNPLNATTFRKLPMQAPIKNTKIDYVAVSKNQLILCLIDKEVGDWLADEEKFNDEEPLWFSESSHRISPVRKVDVARDILKTKLAVTDMKYEIITYVIIQAGNIINAEDMFEIWSNMNINVTRINRGSPKEIRLFSKTIDNCDGKTDGSNLEKLKKLIRSLA